jgi:hypothetical protein
MPFESRVYRHDISFEIPDDEFLNLLHYDEANYREFDLPVLSTMLDYIEGAHEANYSGHFGAQVFAGFDVDNTGKTPQVAAFQALLDDFFVDVRRIAAIIPEIMTSKGRHNVELAELFDENDNQARRELVYCDDDFLISTGAGDGFSIFHREGGELQRVDAEMPRSVYVKIQRDRDERSFDRRERKQITMSKDIKGVREWVVTLVPLDVKVPSVDVSDHPLSAQLPDGSRAVLAHPKFIVADSGRDLGVSITFASEGEYGTKWFTDEARKGILKQIVQSQGSHGLLSGWILRQLPSDVEAPGMSRK